MPTKDTPSAATFADAASLPNAFPPIARPVDPAYHAFLTMMLVENSALVLLADLTANELVTRWLDAHGMLPRTIALASWIDAHRLKTCGAMKVAPNGKTIAHPAASTYAIHVKRVQVETAILHLIARLLADQVIVEHMGAVGILPRAIHLRNWITVAREEAAGVHAEVLEDLGEQAAAKQAPAWEA